MRAAAIVLAGGSGTRLGSGVNKVYLEIGGRPLLAYSLETFSRVRSIERLVVVIRPEDRALVNRALEEAGVAGSATVVQGGATRHDSEMKGLRSISAEMDAGEIDVVAIHDGARPYPTRALVESVLDTASRIGGAVPALPTPQHLVEAGVHGARPLPSGSTVRVQTPQAFLATPLFEAYKRATGAGFTGVDTAETVERFSTTRVAVVAGDPRNLKVTYPADHAEAERANHCWVVGRWNDER